MLRAGQGGPLFTLLSEQTVQLLAASAAMNGIPAELACRHASSSLCRESVDSTTLRCSASGTAAAAALELQMAAAIKLLSEAAASTEMLLAIPAQAHAMRGGGPK